jgi:hypothetical protein
MNDGTFRGQLWAIEQHLLYACRHDADLTDE